MHNRVDAIADWCTPHEHACTVGFTFGTSMSALVNAPPYRDVTQKWRNLAERRRAYFVELYQSGRWKHYYSEEQFLLRMREVIYAAEAWSELANAAEHPAPAD